MSVIHIMHAFIKTKFIVYNKRFETLNQEQLYVTGNKNQLGTT
jgi:hypothetical protein